MAIKFDRLIIESINGSQRGSINRNTNMGNYKRNIVPEKETFEYIFENAKKGNEMAAVLLDEWQKCCKPKDAEEKQIVDLINSAVNQLFK